MAKVGEGAPYVVEALKAGPTPAIADVENAALEAVSADLCDVVNKYYRIDWHFVAAAMELIATSLKSHLDPPALSMEERLVENSISIATIVPRRQAGGGNSPDGMKRGAK